MCASAEVRPSRTDTFGIVCAASEGEHDQSRQTSYSVLEFYRGTVLGTGDRGNTKYGTVFGIGTKNS